MVIKNHTKENMLGNQLKDLFKKSEDGTSKKKIENLVVLIIILIITIIVINTIWNGTEKTEKEPAIDKNKKLAESSETIQTSSMTNEEQTIQNLEEILSKINGVGNVKVMITYSKTNQIIPLYNEDSTQKNTEETDKQGGSRKVIETDSKKEIIYKEESGEKVPITQSVISPVMEGAIITAQGASNANVKTNIIQAVEAVTGLATHKIQVFEMIK